MENIVWPIVIMVLYFIMLIGVALYTRKKSNSLNDFLLGGRGVGGWMSAFSYGTTYFSAVIFIGYAGKFGWQMGLSSIWIGIANAVIGSFIAWRLLAKRTRFISRDLGTSTMPQLFAERYQSRGLKLFSAIIIFVFLLPYSASVYQGIGALFVMVFDIPYYWCIIIMAVITALYLFLGGYLATTLSDFIQGIIMLVGIIVCVALLVASPNFAEGGGFEKLKDLDLGFIPTQGSVIHGLSSMVLLTSFGIWALPQSVHKYYAIKDERSIKQASIVSTGFCAIIGCGAYFIGSLGRVFIEDTGQTPVYDEIVPEILVNNLPAGMVGLMLVLLLSASMSTLASMSLAGSSALAVDGYKGFIKRDASEKNVNVTLRIVCVLFILASVIFAVLKIDAIVTLMSLSWGTLAGCFIGPYVLGLYSKRINKAGCYASLICGLLVQVIMLPIMGIGYAPQAGIVAMAVSFIVTPLASIIYSRKVPQHTEELFRKIELDKQLKKYTSYPAPKIDL